MAESGSTSRGRRPAPIPFDPEVDGAVVSLESIVPDADGVPALLLVAGAEARANGWAARVAIEVAARFGERRGDVLLADLSTEGAALSGPLDVPEGEGLADVFLFGASLDRVARPVPDRSFRFAPTGAYVPDPETLLAHPRWERLIGEFAETGGLLLLHAPADAPGLSSLARRAGHAVILAGSDVEADGIETRLPYACGVEAVLSPPDDGGTAPREPDGADPTAEAVAEDVAGTVGGDVSGSGGFSADAGAPSEDELIRELAVIHRESERRRSSLVAVVIGVLIALVAAGWFVLRDPGAESTSSAAGQPDAVAAAATTGASENAAAEDDPGGLPAPSPIDSPLRYSVVIESHEELAGANERVAGLRDDRPDVDFYIAPVLVGEDPYYRVLAGPVADSVGAANLMQRLVDAGVMDSPQPWAVRSTTHAFHLGDFHTADAARARARELRDEGVPVYVVEVPFDAGSPRFRLYGGAYQGAAEARLMARLLAERQLAADLIRRIGRPAS